jgi:hypothetical protein
VYFDSYLSKICNFKLLILLLIKYNKKFNLDFFLFKKKVYKKTNIKKEVKNIIFYYKLNFLILKYINRIKNFYFLKINNYTVKN